MPIDFSKQGMKRPGAVREWTSEEQIEFMKCSQDIIYFAENYVTIVNQEKGSNIRIAAHKARQRTLAQNPRAFNRLLG